MDTVAERQETEAVGDQVEGIAEGVGDPAQVPAQAPGAPAGQHPPGRPAFPEDDVEPVRPPHGQQVDHASAGHVDHVLGQQMGPDVGHVRLGEQHQMGQVRGAEPL